MDNKTLKQKTISGTLWQFAQKTFGQVISFVISVILARILLPSDYGTVALAGMYTVLLGIFVSFGLGAALIQKKNVDDLDLCTVFWAQLSFASIIYIFTFVTAPLFSALFKDEAFTAIIRVSALTMPLGALSTIQNSIVSRSMAFKTYFYRTLVSSICSGIIGLWLAYNGYGAWALVGQHMSSVIIGTITVFSQVRWLPSFKFSKERFLSLFSYGWKYTGSSLVGTVFFQLKGYIIGIFYTKADLAFYNRGASVPGLIGGNILGSISGALFPALTKLQDDKMAVKRGISRSMKTCSYLVMPIFLGIASISEKLVLLVYTEKWSACVPFMQVICIMECLNILASANLQALNAIGRADVVLKIEFYKKPVMLVILIVTAFISPLAICVGLLIYTFWSLAMNALPNKKLIHYPLKEQLMDVLPNTILASSMAVLTYFIGKISPLPSIATLIVQILFGIVFYISMSHLSKNENYIFVRDLVMNYLKRMRNIERVS